MTFDKCQLTTLPPPFFFFFAFFTFSFFIFHFQRTSKASRYSHITNSSWRTIRWDRKNWYRAKTWIGDPRIDQYRSRSRKVYGIFAAPRKRSVSLLAGSWRSTEPGTLKRKLNEISNHQELPRIGPIKPPPVPRIYACILTTNFRRW